MTTQNAELDETVRQFLDAPRAERLAELMAARKADEERTPTYTIIPEPVWPPLWPHPGSGVMRFPCGLGCGWSHGEDIYDDGPPLRIPLGASPESISDVITERAKQRDAVARARIEAAVREHFDQVHPGVEPPERQVW